MPCKARRGPCMTGQIIGHYRILEQIGSGGMGEVYRARDERLGRDVALKLIRPASSQNPDHLRRFEQEARAAAALSHPNILAIYDVGFEGTTPYIVSELLEGVTLRARLGDGPIPIREATDYALQIVHGLVAAHERRIVHRDLKPENVFLTKDRRIKILDFGVAKLQAPPEESGSADSKTTVTKSGVVVGTVAYMSPEQLRAKPVDHRSDIFSFGAVLYEMLSGRRAFRGETEVDTMTAVLREEPPEADLEQAAIPQAYKNVVKHCLEKEPDNRFQSAKDLAFALQTLSGQSTDSGILPAKPARRKNGVLPWAVAALLAAALLVFGGRQLLNAPHEPVYQRLTYELGTVYSARFAPDGHSIVYSAAWNGRPVQLFSTVGNSVLSQPLNLGNSSVLSISRGNDLAVVLRGSHNGQLETTNGMLATAPLAGGAAREVLSDVRWADWGPDGNLAVVHSTEGGSRLEYPIGNALYQDSGWLSHVRLSPQGNAIAFLHHPALWDDRGAVWLFDLATGHTQALTPDWEHADGIAWRPDGKEIWFTAAAQGNSSNLMAVTRKGAVRTVLTLPGGLTLQDVSADGRVLATANSKRLAMATGKLGSNEDSDLSWHDWNVAKDISRDGQFLLFEDASEAIGPNYAVVIRKLDGSLPTRLGEGSAGGLSPDGQWAISISTGNPERVTLLPTGAGQPRLLHQSGLEHIRNGWARFLPDGESITVNANEPEHTTRCYVLTFDSNKPRAITPEGTSCGPSSPDGKFVVGKRAGSDDIYPIGGGPTRAISGLQPGFNPVQWSQDGTTLYGYRDGELPAKIYKVEITTGKTTVVQELHPDVPAGVVNIAPVVVSRDGTRFAYSYNQTLSVLYLISGLR